MRISVTGAATTEQVWRRYVTPELWPTWSPQIRGVACADKRIGPGSAGVVHGPAFVRVPFVVLAVNEAERTWSWRVGRPIGITMTHGVDEAPHGGSSAWLEIPLALAAYAPIARLALHRLVEP